jgi:serine/threonine protein phosphatase PrpC
MVKTNLKFAGASDMGRVRRNNEDAWHADAERGIYLVVDGVGGHAAGEKAAEIAVERVRARLERLTGSTEQRIREAITVANNEILRAARENPDWEGMACVLTVAVLENGSAVIGHVGDSRLYQIRGGHIRKVTHDHSPVGEREDSRELTEAEAMKHPRRNEVYRDVGSEEHAPDDSDFIEIQRIDFDPESALLLCTDGLSDLVTSDRIRELVERHAGEPEAAVRGLIAAANEAGGKDNVTIVIVEGEGFTAPAVEMRTHRANWFVPAMLAVAVGLLAVAFAIWRTTQQKPPVPQAHVPAFFTVGPNALPNVAAALAQAQPRDTIYVMPGEYTEPIALKSNVAIVAQPPREAVLRAPVTADHVQDARLSGFAIRVEGPAAVVLTDSSVEIDDSEISGPEVGIVIRGGGRSVLKANNIHDCLGVGVLLSGPVAPWISHNILARNKKAGLVAAEGARPALSGNTFDHNKLDLPPEMDLKAVHQHNYFIPPAPYPPVSQGGRR